MEITQGGIVFSVLQGPAILLNKDIIADLSFVRGTPWVAASVSRTSILVTNLSWEKKLKNLSPDSPLELESHHVVGEPIGGQHAVGHSLQ